MTTEITESWFTNLIEDLNSIVDGAVELRFIYSWELIECYHQMGTRILQENDNFERSKIYGGKIVKRVAESIGRSEKTVYNAIKFAKMFPDLNMLPEGKNCHWRHIINKYLTEGDKPVKITPTEMIKQIKQLLQHEWEKENQSIQAGEPSEFSNLYDFIRYLQDQINKITGG